METLSDALGNVGASGLALGAIASTLAAFFIGRARLSVSIRELAMAGAPLVVAAALGALAVRAMRRGAAEGGSLAVSLAGAGMGTLVAIALADLVAQRTKYSWPLGLWKHSSLLFAWVPAVGGALGLTGTLVGVCMARPWHEALVCFGVGLIHWTLLVALILMSRRRKDSAGIEVALVGGFLGVAIAAGGAVAGALRTRPVAGDNPAAVPLFAMGLGTLLAGALVVRILKWMPAFEWDSSFQYGLIRWARVVARLLGAVLLIAAGALVVEDLLLWAGLAVVVATPLAAAALARCEYPSTAERFRGRERLAWEWIGLKILQVPQGIVVVREPETVDKLEGLGAVVGTGLVLSGVLVRTVRLVPSVGSAAVASGLLKVGFGGIALALLLGFVLSRAHARGVGRAGNWVAKTGSGLGALLAFAGLGVRFGDPEPSIEASALLARSLLVMGGGALAATAPAWLVLRVLALREWRPNPFDESVQASVRRWGPIPDPAKESRDGVAAMGVGAGGLLLLLGSLLTLWRMGPLAGGLGIGIFSAIVIGVTLAWVALGAHEAPEPPRR